MTDNELRKAAARVFGWERSGNTEYPWWNPNGTDIWNDDNPLLNHWHRELPPLNGNTAMALLELCAKRELPVQINCMYDQVVWWAEINPPRRQITARTIIEACVMALHSDA